jgi:hypothetical protein
MARVAKKAVKKSNAKGKPKKYYTVTRVDAASDEGNRVVYAFSTKKTAEAFCYWVDFFAGPDDDPPSCLEVSDRRVDITGLELNAVDPADYQYEAKCYAC